MSSLLAVSLFNLGACASSTDSSNQPSATATSNAASTGTATATAAETATATATAAVASASAEAAIGSEELTIDPSDLEVDTAKNIVRFNRDGQRQSATYRIYELDRDEFIKVVGSDTPKDTITLKVDLLSENVSNRSPSNPNMPAPKGGFTFKVYKCRIVGLSK